MNKALILFSEDCLLISFSPCGSIGYTVRDVACGTEYRHTRVNLRILGQ